MAEKQKKIVKYFTGKRNTSKSGRSVLRPNAAMKEKERLKTFNEALNNLQAVIPVKLPEGRKLHKKQTLQFACRYIQFLRGCLDGSRDWSDRSRFWCESDEDYSMIDAIDAAATAVSSRSKKQVESGSGANKKSENQQANEVKLTRKGLTSVVEHDSVSSGCSYGYWLTQRTRVKSFSSSSNRLRFQLPVFSMTSSLYHTTAQRRNYDYDVGNESATSQHMEMTSSESPVPGRESVTGANMEAYRFQGSTAATSTGCAQYLQSASDLLDEEWSDLRDILF